MRGGLRPAEAVEHGGGCDDAGRALWRGLAEEGLEVVVGVADEGVAGEADARAELPEHGPHVAERAALNTAGRGRRVLDLDVVSWRTW